MRVYRKVIDVKIALDTLSVRVYGRIPLRIPKTKSGPWRMSDEISQHMSEYISDKLRQINKIPLMSWFMILIYIYIYIINYNYIYIYIHICVRQMSWHICKSFYILGENHPKWVILWFAMNGHERYRWFIPQLWVRHVFFQQHFLDVSSCQLT